MILHEKQISKQERKRRAEEALKEEIKEEVKEEVEEEVKKVKLSEPLIDYKDWDVTDTMEEESWSSIANKCRNAEEVRWVRCSLDRGAGIAEQALPCSFSFFIPSKTTSKCCCSARNELTFDKKPEGLEAELPNSHQRLQSKT